MSLLVRALVALLAVLAFGSAQAQLFRTYLSLSGLDTNACTLQAPCRLLPAALAAVKDGGEIWMLDSANFNSLPVTITKGVKILAIPGEMGSIVANGSAPVDAITINAPNRDVTLRNLVILNIANGLNGVNILDAGAVHIEKTTIHDFATTAGGCIQMGNADPAKSMRLYVDDSFLRHCHAGIHANYPANATNRASIIVDNTRIERGFADTQGGNAVGVWQQGCVDVILQRSSISRQDTGILVDSLVAGCAPHLEVIDSQLARNTAGVSVANNVAGAQLETSLVRAALTNSGSLLSATNTADNATLTFHIADSHIAYTSGSAITANNSAGDNTRGIFFNISNSQIGSVTTNAFDLTATNASRVRASIRDSTITNVSGRMIKTAGSGAGHVRVELIRNNMQSSPMVLDHGFGQVDLDGNHITNVTDTFVNNGSNSLFTLGNNWLTNFNNATQGVTYITPITVAPF